jgi:hypothetical protein
MLAHIHHKSDRKVDDHGGSYRQKGRIDEEQPDAGSGNSEFIAQLRADAEGITLKKLLDFICQSIHTITTF